MSVGPVDLAKALFEAGGDGDICDGEGRTPLEYAKEKVDTNTYMQLKAVLREPDLPRGFPGLP